MRLDPWRRGVAAVAQAAFRTGACNGGEQASPSSVANLGKTRLVLIASDAQRLLVDESPDIVLVGWA
ncbi:MAG: hypothetical protein ACE5IZ_04295 [Dehalococcoidia bacterium]